CFWRMEFQPHATVPNAHASRTSWPCLPRARPIAVSLPSLLIGFRFASIMKLFSAKTKVEALTLVELLLVIFILMILAALLLPAYTGPRKAPSATCMLNQKQLALGFIMWKSDNSDQFPWQISSTNGGTMEAANGGYAAENFQVLWRDNYDKYPAVFVCPTDKSRAVASDLTQFRNQKLSYFVAVQSSTNVVVGILTGDRHLESDGRPVKTGLFNYGTNLTMNWTHELHGNSQHAFGVFS